MGNRAADLLWMLTGSYLVLTLAATGLAKLDNHVAAVQMLKRDLGPFRRCARFLLVTVCSVELTLAGLIALSFAPRRTEAIAAITFVAFAGYRLQAVARTIKINCPCGAQARGEAVSTGALIGHVAAPLVLAAVSWVWGWAATERSAGPSALAVGVWFLPFLLLALRRTHFIPGPVTGRTEGNAMSTTVET